MRVRKTPEQDLEETRAELAEARAKAAKWNGRVQELEGEVTEKENTMILQAARTIATTPEGLRGLLAMIRAAGPVSASASAVDAAVQAGTLAVAPARGRGRKPVETADRPPDAETNHAAEGPNSGGEGQRNEE